jgi:adenine-specific DNA-methyltransferase
MITKLGSDGWDVADNYAVLVNPDQTSPFLEGLRDSEGVRLVYVVTDDESAFQMVCRDLPGQFLPVRLYESYLQNFMINTGRNL